MRPLVCTQLNVQGVRTGTPSQQFDQAVPSRSYSNCWAPSRSGNRSISTQACRKIAISQPSTARNAVPRVAAPLPHGLISHRCTRARCDSARTDAAPADETIVLCGDIGGTNCRLTVIKVNGEGMDSQVVFQKTYPTMAYTTFEDALAELYQEPAVRAQPPQAAALAVAGPVINNCCRMTNLPWVIDGQQLRKQHGILFAVLNDFAAVGYGVPAVPASDLVVLNDVPVAPEGPKAVLGPGTGLGEAIMVYEESFGGYRVWPSEGSHAAFAPRGWKQRALAAFAEEELDQHCEVEHVACGSGLERIVRFLQSDTADLHVKHSQYTTPEQISKAALSGEDPIALLAVDMFLCILGAEAAHMGLRLLATGGVYICGGIAPKLLARIEQGNVAAAFLDRDARFAPLLKTFPLFLVKNENLGLLGCQQFALKLLPSQSGAPSRGAYTNKATYLGIVCSLQVNAEARKAQQ